MPEGVVADISSLRLKRLLMAISRRNKPSSSSGEAIACPARKRSARRHHAFFLRLSAIEHIGARGKMAEKAHWAPTSSDARKARNNASSFLATANSVAYHHRRPILNGAYAVSSANNLHGAISARRICGNRPQRVHRASALAAWLSI